MGNGWTRWRVLDKSTTLINEIISYIKAIHKRYGVCPTLASDIDIQRSLVDWAHDDSMPFPREEAAQCWANGYTAFGLVEMLTYVWPRMQELRKELRNESNS